MTQLSSLHCAKAARKANSVLGQMAKAFQYRDKFNWVRLYTTYVRPHLEFAVQSWSPWYKRDIEVLEKVQIRAVNMVHGLHGLTYEEKLKALNLTTLSDRRLRGDMIQVWKFVHHESIMDPQTFTSTKSQESRHTRHTAKPLNLVIPQGRLEVRKNFFTVRAVSSWNSLPTWVQNSESMNDFKINYDKFQKVLRR